MVSTHSGHAFISYVHEDSPAVERIERILEAAGINVWRDTDSLWPGQDWKLKIKEAITKNALVFVACFSDNSITKERTYQREELILAAEELRQRSPDRVWFIPVRLSDCILPSYDVGAGRTFESFHRVDLMGEDWDAGIARLVSAVLAILTPRNENGDSSTTKNFPARMKPLLLDDAKHIELEDTVRAAANQAYEVLVDRGVFPFSSDLFTDSSEGVRWFVGQVNKYWAAISELRDALILGCAWGKEAHNRVWTMAIERIAGTAGQNQGSVVLKNLRRYPTTVLLYAGGISAIHRENYASLKAIAWDARTRTDQARLDLPRVPMVGVGHVWLPFEDYEIGAQAVALQSDGVELSDETIASVVSRQRPPRLTPVSDHLHASLREPARRVIDDDRSFTETFDRLEVVLALLAADASVEARKHGGHVWGAWYGSYIWRSRDMPRGPEHEIRDEFQAHPSQWPPIRAGLFGGQVERAEAAFEEVVDGARDARSRYV